MKLIKHGVAAAITMAGALAFSGVALASSADFIDHGHYTTDTNTGLDWLDVTISVNQSYNYVSSQFGSGGEYEGWRYATGFEFNQMVSSWTGTVIADTTYSRVYQHEGAIDQLHFLLGSTLDAHYVALTGRTFDAEFRHEEGDYYDNTFGIILDPGTDGYVWTATILDNDIVPTGPDYTQARHEEVYQTIGASHVGSFVVRDTLTPVPVPAAVWLLPFSV